MKALMNLPKSTYVLFLSFFVALSSFAQDKKVDVEINTKSGNDGFWTQPWVWVVGGAVFILLLVALLRGGKKD